MIREKKDIWRYTEIVFRREMLRNENKDLSDADKAEMDELRTRLGMTHQQILECSAKNLIDDVEC